VRLMQLHYEIDADAVLLLLRRQGSLSFNRTAGREAGMRADRWLVIATVSSLGLVACGGGTADEAPAGPGDGAPPGEVGAALDVEAILAQDLSDCQEPGGEPLRIGYAADLSELGGYADEPGSEAAQFMASLINCAGGVNGTPVEVLIQDIQGDPDVTQRATQDLLDAGVHAILGPPFSDFGLPLLQVVGGTVPVIFVSSTEERLSDAASGSFLMAFDDPAQARAAARFALDQGWRTAVTFTSPDAPYFEQNPRVFTEEFETGGGEVVQDYTYSLDDSEFSTQVNSIAGLDAVPDVLYTAMIMPLIGTLIGQLQGAGIEMEVVGTDAFDATGILGAGDLAEGVYYTTHGFPGAGTRMKAFLDGFEQQHGRQLETVSFGSLAADAVLLVADAFRRVGALDAEAIGQEIWDTENLDLITEAVTYKGTTGTPLKPVFIHQVVGGELSLADTIDTQ
jgi:branched-chain amino acid transport system substrate-binding protein